MSHSDQKAPSWRRRLFKSKGSDPVAVYSTDGRSSRQAGGYNKKKAWIKTTTIEDFQSLPSTPRSTSPPRDARALCNFWEIAYHEIIDDEDEKTRKIVAAYDVLLGRMAHQGIRELGDNGDKGGPLEIVSADKLENQTSNLVCMPLGHLVLANEESDGNTDADDADGSLKRQVGSNEAMRAIAAANLKEMERKEWVMRWKGEVVFKLRDQVTRVVRIAKHVSGLAGQAASANPSAGLAVAGVCVLLPLIINDADERQAAIDGIEVVTRIVARFRTVEEDYASGRYGTNQDFEKTLVALYRAVAFYYMKAACYFARSTPFRTIRGIVEADAWKHTLDSIKSTESECDRFATMLGLSKSLEKVDKVLEDLSRIEFKDLIRDVEAWLIPDVDVAQQHQTKQPKLAAGYDKAGSWLLDSRKFQSWENDAAGKFWISGAVGTGKSSLVAIIVDRMRGEDNVAFFYCTVDTTKSPKGSDDATVIQVLRGILGQLAMSSDRKRIAEEIEVAFDQASQPGALGRVPLSLNGAKDLLVKIINARRGTTIIIDGLDEIPDYNHLLRTLKDINDRVEASRLRLLLASQDVVQVRDFFPSTELAVAGGHDSIADMESFVSGRVKLFRDEHPNIINSDLSEDIVKTLSRKAEGMFKWADLCLSRVLDHESSAAEIQENWKSIKKQKFGGLLVDLVRGYDQAYERSLPSGDPQQRRTVGQAVHRALLWVLGAGRDLGEKEYHALQTGATNNVPSRKTFKVCRNFFHISEHEGITAPHSSVWDYVSLKVTGQVNRFIKFAQSESYSDTAQESMLKEAKNAAASKAQEQIANDCVKLFMNNIGPSTGEEVNNSTSEEVLSPLLRYACLHWTRHFEAAMSSAKDPATVLEQGKTLFKPANSDALRRWVAIYDSDWGSLNTTRSDSKPPDPLYYAIRTGCAEIVCFALDTTEPSSWTGGPLGKPLQLACYWGKTRMVRCILSKVGVNEADDVLGTPLHAAIAGRQREVADILVNEYHADVKAPSAAFGNAMQMAIALGDHDLLQLLASHGPQYKPADSRAKIWAKVWQGTSDSEPYYHTVLSASQWPVRGDGFSWLSITGKPAPPRLLPTALGLNWRLRLLHTCVVCQNAFDKHAGCCTKRSLSKDERSSITKHIQTADPTTGGYIPLVAMWVVLALGMTTSDGSGYSDCLSVYEVVQRHETFMRRFGDTIQDPDLDEALAKLFSAALGLLSLVKPQSPIVTFRLFNRSNGTDLRDQKVRELNMFDREAAALEERAQGMAATSRLFSMHNERTTAALDTMAKDISEMKLQISQLTRSVQLLVELQQKPRSGLEP